jgi:phosphoinositide-3-kinase regulatory subunit 4
MQHWLAYQLLHSLAQAHGRGVCHGDIKCENVLVTSWAWLYLADFASYKPTYLPVDNPVRAPFFSLRWGLALPHRCIFGSI